MVVSAQFLIDSESNIDMALAAFEQQNQEADAPSQVSATGTIEGVKAGLKPQQRLLTITHDPIDAWQWPTMKMDFNVAESVDTTVLTEGQKIEFTIEKTGEWDYLVTAVSLDKGMAKDRPQTQPDEAEEDARTRVVLTQGEIKEVIAADRMVGIVHDPIPEWGVAGDEYDFSVAENQSIDDLKAGQRVTFKLTETEDGEYIVDNIQPEQQ